jgi:signal transduction histidine kinase
MIKRMMNALLDNAVKNTTKGRITVKASADEEELTLTVEDTGCGIPEDKIENIFDRFVTTDSSGSGLGLAICKEVVTLLGGKIRLKSELGKGTIVWIIIPCKCKRISR